MNKFDKIKNSVLPIVNNFSPALVSSLSALSLINPGFLPLISLAQSILGYWGDYANNKTQDLIQDFIDNKENIIGDVVATDKFKANFLKIISDNITESNEEKRQYLKNYIVNFACGVDPDFNEHSKLIYTLNNITLEEMEMLKLWNDDGAIEKQYRMVGDSPDRNIRNNTLDINAIENIIHTQKPQLKILKIERQNQSKNNQILLTLGYKGLLYVLGADNFGSGVEARTKGLTDFGKIFLKFIKK
ncbi:MAG: hypothetical protein COU29_00175 [Candidatus Magasanikbacteria bacterium CG10_big_fil_rev_8_21_14_0_10_36_32]|uniref:Uncharacterized protein n=1 Tax=Candidatus Magasanikbacteria bacterium CG10_big_fil_rev_8_21_14_0_10_36_32 TaxID=1974646 RepID=A0A2M6W7S6_9BACT|nr:MAG: hypothetical protein COU29_00175 [Candidatus Magasanikbacteria bacterium CG10_big_fil_rev_8_21_14_0_10_36_32]